VAVSQPDRSHQAIRELDTLLDGAENDVLAFVTFPRAHLTQIYGTNPLERLNAH
jgi:putative transposase